MAESGYPDVPVISLASGSGVENNQPGFKMNWLKIIGIVVAALLYSDCIAKFYYAAVVREKGRGMAARLRDYYLAKADPVIRRHDTKGLWALLGEAAEAFNDIIVERRTHKVGIVGEIYLKFNPFAQKDITNWLTEQGIEVVPPLLTDFFLQSFVNTLVNRDNLLESEGLPRPLLKGIYALVWSKIKKANRICSAFRIFTPFESIFAKADEAEQVVSLYAQFGEGWLLPGEILSMAHQGVNHVVSLQPFGCIANHIVARGIENRMKRLYPNLNLLSLDFDSGVSDVNLRNRILLFLDNILGVEA